MFLCILSIALEALCRDKHLEITFREAPAFRVRKNVYIGGDNAVGIHINGTAIVNTEIGLIINKNSFGMFLGPYIIRNFYNDKVYEFKNTGKDPVLTRGIGLYYYRNKPVVIGKSVLRFEAGARTGYFEENYKSVHEDYLYYVCKNVYYGGPVLRSSFGVDFLQFTLGAGALFGRRTSTQKSQWTGELVSGHGFAFSVDIDAGLVFLFDIKLKRR